ncbi:hypothetical protein UlMin_000157 [Ulmus minor]
MVFSSLPPYHDPSNWQQQPNHPIGGATTGTGSQPLPPPPSLPPPPPSQPHDGGGASSIRPGSMADRARMANIPLPEAALKCPRCESSNTKFCYFNNYSLTQPRHFCKTCRRYWTRGGALRNVPVGGGCRRNKRSKGSRSSKSPVSSDHQSGASASSSAIPSNTGTSTADILGLSQQFPPLRFMAPLHNLTDFGGEMGLNYGLSYGAASDLNFHIGSASSLLQGGASGSGGIEQWRLQQPPQFPFLPGLDPSPALSFDSGMEVSGFHVRPKASSSGITHQMASVKMEDNHELNLSRQFLGIPGNDQYWNGGSGTSSTAWTDLSGFSSSSATSNPQ